MQLIFLGTGGAWGLPEHQCPCATCRHLRKEGQARTRTSLWLEGPARVLVDPGPDLRAQLMREDLPRPDAVLITHEHGDHYLGLDDLLCYRRNLPPEQWQPIPVYATEATWEQVEARFAYLLGSLLEKRLAVPGQDLVGAPFGPELAVRPVKTDHGPIPKGSVGYIFTLATQNGPYRLGYTSDMLHPLDPEAFAEMDLLVCQCHFVHEPAHNRANHLSLQRALPQLASWRPGQVFFVHLSCQDYIPGDEAANAMLKKYAPADPLRDPDGQPYPIPPRPGAVAGPGGQGAAPPRPGDARGGGPRRPAGASGTAPGLLMKPPRLAIALALVLGLALLAWAGGRQAVVLYVNDGDTITVRLAGKKELVRLIGVDAPETGHSKALEHRARQRNRKPRYEAAAGRDSRRAAMRLVRKGDTVTLLDGRPHSGERDRYGRLLAFVYLPNGRLLNQELIANGWARVYRRFEYRHKKDFLRAQKQARQEKRGLWDIKGGP